MSSRPKNELIRIAAYEGDISIDPTGKAKGRGVYVCSDLQCLKKAEKRNALARSLSVEISKEQMEKFSSKGTRDYSNIVVASPRKSW